VDWGEDGMKGTYRWIEEQVKEFYTLEE